MRANRLRRGSTPAIVARPSAGRGVGGHPVADGRPIGRSRHLVARLAGYVGEPFAAVRAGDAVQMLVREQDARRHQSARIAALGGFVEPVQPLAPRLGPAAVPAEAGQPGQRIAARSSSIYFISLLIVVIMDVAIAIGFVQA
ncbi:hypothetical protein PDENDC454_14972 [Paenibacillus dendritiformis C454]|uniref:Uncharacterized protein n=1 Tax=Paenibacillus dendritiformis C454 TaxID=1131935 RepID=H3SHI1_9BACL|nr:hypothetical protein PDENDC454_14972 [Paenibacillus dendritiformis C454]